MDDCLLFNCYCWSLLALFGSFPTTLIVLLLFSNFFIYFWLFHAFEFAWIFQSSYCMPAFICCIRHWLRVNFHVMTKRFIQVKSFSFIALKNFSLYQNLHFTNNEVIVDSSSYLKKNLFIYFNEEIFQNK